MRGATVYPLPSLTETLRLVVRLLVAVGVIARGPDHLPLDAGRPLHLLADAPLKNGLLVDAGGVQAAALAVRCRSVLDREAGVGIDSVGE